MAIVEYRRSLSIRGNPRWARRLAVKNVPQVIAIDATSISLAALG
jgi:hypothetical protein